MAESLIEYMTYGKKKKKNSNLYRIKKQWYYKNQKYTQLPFVKEWLKLEALTILV